MVKSVKIIACPRCNKSCEYHEKNEFRPFCSAACKNDDIVAWADEEYTTPDREASSDEILNEIRRSNKD